MVKLERIDKIYKKNLIYILLIIIWMITVFMFSAQDGEKSSKTSKTVSEIIVQSTNMSKNKKQKDELIKSIDPYIRKIAHFTLYAIGGIFTINYLRTINIKRNRQFIISELIGILYAISDEFHQHFINYREAQFTDVLIDTVGFTLGIIIFIIGKNVVNKERDRNEH